MSGDSDVSEFVEDHEQDERPELRTLNKGMKAACLAMKHGFHETQIGPEAQKRKALERSEAQRDVKITLPKLKFLDEPENEL
jgi:ABC-type phosphate transport system auxiliary subunit